MLPHDRPRSARLRRAPAHARTRRVLTRLSRAQGIGHCNTWFSTSTQTDKTYSGVGHEVKITNTINFKQSGNDCNSHSC